MVPVQGFEPQFLDPKSNVLPLDDTGVGSGSWTRTSTPGLTVQYATITSHRNWRGEKDSNPRLAVYKTAAVATEPPPHMVRWVGIEPTCGVATSDLQSGARPI